MFWMTLAFYVLAALDVGVAFTYTWPNPTAEAWDKLLYTNFLSSIADDCTFRNIGKSSAAAQWLRFAYHDMATHNIEDGTGGLDGSLHFEIPLKRSENIGPGLRNTQVDFNGISDGVISKADVIAIGAVLAVAACGGPILDFRGGRIDATGPGPAGVPEPQQLIDEHVEKFRKQGFNETEMITLVACGHTFGGVRNLDFPEIVGLPPAGSGPTVNENIVSFDSPTEVFDNNVVTQYLDDTTKNPLVVGPSTANLSDLRIFSRDGNITMKSLSTPSVYNARCKSLLERMLDTVPKGVELTDTPISVIEEKVYQAQFVVLNETYFAFRTAIRFSWQTPESAPSPDRIVRFCWCDRRGPAKDCSEGTAHCALPGLPMLDDQQHPSRLARRLGLNFTATTFLVPINPSLSISQFWFEVIEDGSRYNVVNTDGENFVIEQDEVILRYLRGSSSGMDGRQAIGVHESKNASRVILRAIENGPLSQRNDSFVLQLNDTLPPIGGYRFFTMPTILNPLKFTNLDAVVDMVDGESITLLNQPSPFDMLFLTPQSTMIEEIEL